MKAMRPLRPVKNVVAKPAGKLAGRPSGKPSAKAAPPKRGAKDAPKAKDASKKNGKPAQSPRRAPEKDENNAPVRHDQAPMPGGLRGLPIVAIVGRPNVGKSTLFNRLAREKLAIVHDEPGVTRDRHYADTTAFGRPYTLIDTGGFDPESDDPMKSGIATHVKLAIAEADAIVFLTDGTTDLTSADRAAVQLLRQAQKPVFFAANKVDSPKGDAEATDLYRAGVKHIYYVSALHGRGVGELEAALVRSFPEALPGEEVEDATVARVAVVGKPNAGKSSLLNRVLGEDRMLVDAEPGTTRDSIDALVTRGEKRYVFIDTAGIRRKGKVTKADDGVESASVMHAIRSIERSHVTVLLCDAKEGVAEQDAKILGLAQDRSRGMIIALNKTDLLTREETKRAEDQARDKISFAPYVEVVRMSAKTGRGVSDLFTTIDNVRAAFTKRVGTGELNRFFEQVLDTHPPPTQGGKAPRIYYVTQAETSPPTFVAITNAPDSIHFSYRRFVINQLRKTFGFEGVPIRVFYKQKRRAERPEAEGASYKALQKGRSRSRERNRS